MLPKMRKSWMILWRQALPLWHMNGRAAFRRMNGSWKNRAGEWWNFPKVNSACRKNTRSMQNAESWYIPIWIELWYGICFGTLHFVAESEWKRFINNAKQNTNIGSIHIIQIFTDTVPASEDIAPLEGTIRHGKFGSRYCDFNIWFRTQKRNHKLIADFSFFYYLAEAEGKHLVYLFGEIWKHSYSHNWNYGFLCWTFFVGQGIGRRGIWGNIKTGSQIMTGGVCVRKDAR